METGRMPEITDDEKPRSIEEIMAMLPGVKPGALKDAKIDEKALVHMEAIIRSMTPEERSKPEIINASCKVRIANGAGVKVQEVNALLKQFDQMRSMVKKFSAPGGMKKFKRMKFPF